MGALNPVKLIGVGPIWNVTDNIMLSNQAEMGISFDISTIDVPAGDTFATATIPTLQEVSGRLGFRDVHTALIAASMGGASEAPSVSKPSYRYLQREAITVTTGTPTALTVQPEKFGVSLGPIECVDTAGTTFKQVASGATPAVGEFKDTGAGKLLAFNTGYSGTVYVSYWEAVTTGATMSSVYYDPATIPGNKIYLFAGKVYNTRLKAWKGFMSVLVKKLQRTGSIGYAVAVSEAGSFGFDFKATADIAGDVIISFEEA